MSVLLYGGLLFRLKIYSVSNTSTNLVLWYRLFGQRQHLKKGKTKKRKIRMLITFVATSDNDWNVFLKMKPKIFRTVHKNRVRELKELRMWWRRSIPHWGWKYHYLSSMLLLCSSFFCKNVRNMVEHAVIYISQKELHTMKRKGGRQTAHMERCLWILRIQIYN